MNQLKTDVCTILPAGNKIEAFEALRKNTPVILLYSSERK